MAEQDIFEREIIFDELKRTLDIYKTDENQFRARAKDIQATQRKFLKLQTKIEKSLLNLKTFDREEQLRIRNEFSDIYYAILSNLDEIKNVDEECRRMSRAALYPRQPSHASCDIKKLPTLPLPSFSGDSTDWTPYYDLFRSMVHSNDAYTDAEKFRYLLLTLKDEPFNLIKSLPIINENYQIALDILVSRYENKRAIATKHIDRIIGIESCSDKNSRSLRNLLNTYQENIKALEAMRFPTREWSFLLLHILLRKIPNSIRQRFELSLPNVSDIPNVDTLIEFLNRELIASELLLSNENHQNRNRNESGCSNRVLNTSRYEVKRSLAVNTANPASSNSSANESSTSSYENKNNQCVCCGDEHSVIKCSLFLSRSPFERYTLLKGKDACFNCLGRGHNVSNCKSKGVCRSCQKKHHTLIHFPRDNVVISQSNDKPDPSTQHVMTSARHALSSDCTASNARSVRASTVLLSTALIDVYVGELKRSTVRCVVDTGSQASFMTDACAQRLGLKRRFADVPIFGIGDKKPVHPKGIISCSISPKNASDPNIQINCLILPKLIPLMPSVLLPHTEWSHIKNLKLADPSFHTPQPVEMLLGADVLSHILLNDVITGPPGTPIAMNSVFGYLLLGKLAFDSSTPSSVQACFSSLFNDGDLKKFWELESVPEVQVLTPEERLCESIFESSHCRDVTGRYSVALPRKPEAQPLGDSKEIANARLLKLEQRLERNPSLKDEYHSCLQEYVELNHMEPVYDRSDPPELGSLEYYIPHHAVVKEASETTKIRVVFDANSPSSNGTSLNDILLTGPKLHQDIVDILLKFRVHRVALTADIKQMYRNILVHEADRDLQRILWRASRDDPIVEYRLRTVTFGVNCSPYLALRVIKQLAYDEQSTFPLASTVLLDQVFVDDVVSGADDEFQALALQKELIGICKSAGFELRKWHSNSPAILAAIKAPLIQGERQEVSFAPMENDNQTKVLGLRWNPQTDQFSFSVQCSADGDITKRTILSQIAKIYDPMGWLSPITMVAKHLMQMLWRARIEWDQRPPLEIVNAWTAFNQELPLLSRIVIPRFIFPCSGNVSIHGFSDASERGISGAVYVRLIDEDKNIQTFLLLAKTRVAPISPCLTIPRLELMAAVMLSKLIEKVLQTYKNRINIEEVVAWSDSSIVLAWLRSPPYEWKTFVSNRVSEILSRIPNVIWRHVPSPSNPADAPSRGILPSALLQNELWFHGPHWLREEPNAWPLHNTIPSTNEEKRNTLSVTTAPATQPDEIEIINRFSTLNKLVRVTSLIFRFYNKLKSRVNKQNDISYPSHITVHEFNVSLKRLIYLVQNQVFHEDIKNISKGKPPSNNLIRLNPFVDELKFLRVGGRLHKSLLPYESKHQLILPKKHTLTKLIIDDAHLANLHAGTQSVLYSLLQKYWILSSRDVIRQQIHRCVRCFRARPVRTQPAMAPLPASRLRPEPPFVRTSIDFAGPLYTKPNKVRNAKITKCYVAVFVCMSVKAVHLELVSELSTDAFLAALRRFVSRRGLIKEIFSDCGRNFVGCDNYLKELYTFLRTDSVQCVLNSKTLNQGITWHFQPPYAPHFGGLFEAAVRSFKHCFRRVVGTQTLSYEEMHTLLCQIEAILNSRPLCVLSSDADDPLPLTPAHFLVGGPLTAIPDVSLINENPGRLVRWRWTQQCVQHFWRRWSHEYLHEIQQRSKWYLDHGTPIGVGDIVLVRDDNLPPLQWQLARVHTLHPGTDGIVRVVTLQIGKNQFKRAVVKLCKLPIE